jgi:hypothetical protein
MISIGKLGEILVGDWAVFDKHGNAVDLAVPKDVGPAALLVTDVTDALKRVDEADRIVESVDRRDMWSVEAIVLNSIVLRRLEDDRVSVEGLMDAVRAAGFAWQIRPISVP